MRDAQPVLCPAVPCRTLEPDHKCPMRKAVWQTDGRNLCHSRMLVARLGRSCVGYGDEDGARAAAGHRGRMWIGGLSAAQSLAKLPVDVVVIDRTNHHLFQPLLYQVSMAALAPSDIASPVRNLIGKRANVSVMLGEVTGIDQKARQVLVRDTAPVAYDFLVLATGSAYSWFGHDAWADHAAVLKTLPDALEIRQRVLAAFDWAESRTDPEEIARLLTFVVVGGGPTGVE
jgi:NADPH-dependent 2,4-dienoyl-CoA reductase/sulfur reductase-like enzyme